MRRIVDYAKFAVFGWMMWVGCMATVPVSAQGSEVLVQVCGEVSTARLEITAPQSDTVVRQSPLLLEGTAELINQVEVYIDGLYHKVSAIPRSQTEFSVAVDLLPRTQTIEVRGVDVCSGDTLRDQIVITYKPAIDPTTPPPPSTGAETPTVTSPTPPGDHTGGGVVVSNPNPTEKADDKEAANWLERVWKWVGGSDWGRRLFQSIDIDATAERISVDGLRVLAFLTGLGAIMCAGFKRRWKWRLRMSLIGAGTFLILASVLALF